MTIIFVCGQRLGRRRNYLLLFLFVMQEAEKRPLKQNWLNHAFQKILQDFDFSRAASIDLKPVYMMFPTFGGPMDGVSFGKHYSTPTVRPFYLKPCSGKTLKGKKAEDMIDGLRSTLLQLQKIDCEKHPNN